MIWGIVIAIISITSLTVFFIRWGLLIGVVEGISMLPTYRAGDRLLVLRFGIRHRLNKGAIVVLDSSKLPISDITLFDGSNNHIHVFDEEPAMEDLVKQAKIFQINGANTAEIEQIIADIEANFHSSGTLPTTFQVKRVVGVPGETIRLNNRDIPPTAQRPSSIRDGDYTIWTIPADHYFVMGDNRNGSVDSRFYGVIPRSALHGVAVYQFSGNA